MAFHFKDSLDIISDPPSLSLCPTPVHSPSSSLKSERDHSRTSEMRPYFEYDKSRDMSKCNILVYRQDADGVQRKMPCGYTYSGIKIQLYHCCDFTLHACTCACATCQKTLIFVI